MGFQGVKVSGLVEGEEEDASEIGPVFGGKPRAAVFPEDGKEANDDAVGAEEDFAGTHAVAGGGTFLDGFANDWILIEIKPGGLGGGAGTLREKLDGALVTGKFGIANFQQTGIAGLPFGGVEKIGPAKGGKIIAAERAAGLVVEGFKTLTEEGGEDGIELAEAILPADGLVAVGEFAFAPEAEECGGEGDGQNDPSGSPVGGLGFRAICHGAHCTMR